MIQHWLILLLIYTHFPLGLESNNNVEGQNTIQTLRNRDFLNVLLCLSAGSGESAESQCEETGHWSVVRLRCGQGSSGGPGPLSRSGDTNVYFVEGGRGGHGNNVREETIITSLRVCLVSQHLGQFSSEQWCKYLCRMMQFLPSSKFLPFLHTDYGLFPWFKYWYSIIFTGH